MTRPMTEHAMAAKDDKSGSMTRGKMGGIMFQHRHFAWMAAAIKEYDGTLGRKPLADHFVKRLRSTNPGFSESRFMKACRKTNGIAEGLAGPASFDIAVY